MEDISKLMEQYGIKDDAPKIKNTGTAFHVFENGGYTALVGNFIVQYVNANKDKCKKDEPGAKPAYGMFDLVIVKDPSENIILNKDYSINQEVDYGAHIYKQYITLDSDRQFHNKTLFSTFTIANSPISVVIEDGGEYEISLGTLPAFVGIPCTFEITETKAKNGKVYKNLNNLELKVHTLDEKLLKQRQAMLVKVYAQIDVKKPVKKETSAQSEEPISDVGNPEDMLNDFN